MTDKEIDDYLKKFELQKYPLIPFVYENEMYEDEFKLADKMTESVNFNYLTDEVKLLKIVKNVKADFNLYSLTAKGRKVLRQGGWLKYLERKEEIEIRKEKKENAELKISEFQARNQHLPYIVSFCGVFISIVSLFITCNNSSDEPSQKKEHTLEYKLEEKKIQTNENLDSDTLSLKSK